MISIKSSFFFFALVEHPPTKSFSGLSQFCQMTVKLPPAALRKMVIGDCHQCSFESPLLLIHGVA